MNCLPEASYLGDEALRAQLAFAFVAFNYSNNRDDITNTVRFPHQID